MNLFYHQASLFYYKTTVIIEPFYILFELVHNILQEIDKMITQYLCRCFD